MARRYLGLMLVVAAILVTSGCKHKKGSQVGESSSPCCSPMVVESCGCDGGPGYGGSYHGGGHRGGGSDCGCNGH